MSDDGEQPIRASRLASALSSPKKTTEATPKDTTLGGVQKTKFAPVIAARRAKKEPTETTTEQHVVEKPARRDQDRPGRGRGGSTRGGRGRGGGKGLLSDRSSVPAYVSGPFSMGPSNSRGGSSSSVNVGFAPPTRSSGRVGGSGRGGFSGRSRGGASSAVSQMSGPVEEGSLFDLDRLIDMESLDLGEDYCPVYISADCDKKKAMEGESTARLSDLLETDDGVFLLQLPSALPAIEAQEKEQVELQENEETKPEIPVEGEIGRLLFHQSGKVTLEINGIRYTLETAEGLSDLPHITGAQSIVAIDPEYEQSFELADVRHTLLGSLDFSSALHL